jgi:hypothetical protein
VRITSCSQVDSALRAVEVRGGTLDFNGLACTAAIELHSSPLLLNQVRFVRLTNCGGGLNAPAGLPVFRVAAGVAAYFVEVDNCLILGTVDASRVYSSTFRQLWILPPAGQDALRLVGPAYYNVFAGLYVGGPIVAQSSGGVYDGPNTNTLRESRIQSTVTIGANVQNWRIRDNAFEGCGAVCLSLAGTRLEVGSGNRFECAGPVGIDLLAGSDGVIETQYWSSCGIRVRLSGADPLNWRIAPQPGQQ